MSFDLVVWALDRTGEPADVTAGHKRCVAGIHAAGVPDRRINAFYADLTARYPDRGAASNASPFVSKPLHVARDHVEMKLVETCPDEVLLLIEQLAGAHNLMLLDVQGGSVYPPQATARPPQ
ncbi:MULTISPECIES: hypothetical protein [Catenuloplanes]|uniref:Uncharacterized protein n=1 Tax=Catenuloplanes niger TaxID=587534 RepID=A0AAE3ZVT6_9ACTN|nr:hypothetical protein [Catenuloplanes niger]MDR7324795.1 hypothetical protein [Catenuloplanes niger]